MSGEQEYDFEYMPFFGYDFYDDDKVIKLSDPGEAWYMRCLWHQWKTGAVPLDEQLARKISAPEFGTRQKDWDRFFAMFQDLFPPIDEYQGQNPRLEEVRAKSIEVTKKKRQGGKKSGEVRRQKRNSDEHAA